MCPKIAVVGAGITGVLTALACAQKGAAVDVYDLNEIPNKNNNSWAIARLCRLVHENSPHLENLATRSAIFWRNMMIQTHEQLIQPVDVLRVNNEHALQHLKKSYTLHGLESDIAEPDSTALSSSFRIKNSSHKVLTGKDGLLLNADSIYQYLISEIIKNKNIKLISNSNLFAKGLYSIHEDKYLRRKYLTVVFSTSMPAKKGSEKINKKFQYHIDISLKSGFEFSDAILDLGDENKSWCVPSLDGKILKLSASNFSFNSFPDGDQKNKCREYLLDMIKLSYEKIKENVSGYYEYHDDVKNHKRWGVDGDSGCVLVEACNAQHFKTAPAVATDISNYIFQ